MQCWPIIKLVFSGSVLYMRILNQLQLYACCRKHLYEFFRVKKSIYLGAHENKQHFID